MRIWREVRNFAWHWWFSLQRCCKTLFFINQGCAECVCLHIMDFVSAGKNTLFLYLTVCEKLYHGWISTMTSSNEISWKLPPRNEELVAPLCTSHFNAQVHTQQFLIIFDFFQFVFYQYFLFLMLCLTFLWPHQISSIKLDPLLFVHRLFSSSVIFPRHVLCLLFVCFFNCSYFLSNCCFLTLVNN